jgi:hypothetical protein
MLSAGNILPASFKRAGSVAHSVLRRVLDLALPPLCAARAAVRFDEISRAPVTHSNMATGLTLHQ